MGNFRKIKRLLILIMTISVVAADTVMAFAEELTVTEEDISTEEVIPDTETGADDFVFVPGYVEIPDKGPVTKVDDSITYSQIEGEINSDSFFTEPDVLRPAFPFGYTQTDEIKNYFATNYPQVRNQNPYGTCWAHSAIGLAEFYMINHDMALPSVDLSELHLAYFSYNQGTPSIAGDTGDTVRYIAANDTISDSGKKNYLNAGGNLEFAAQTLMRQRGAVLESVVPYSDAEKVLSSSIDSSLEREDAVYLKNAMEINISNKDLIKNYIMRNGIVGTSIYANNSNYDNTHNSYYCRTTNTNHVVALVGWDDDFPKENFNSGMRPSNNGAWLVRNSWGYDTYDAMSYNKYFWISYEDYSLTKPNNGNDKSVWIYEMTDKDDHPDNNYYYDSQIHNNGSIFYKDSSLTISSANVYKACSGSDYEDIKAVGFSVSKLASQGTDYSIRIYTDVDPSINPISGTLALTKTGTVYLDGQYTVDLDEDEQVRVAKDSYFTIVVDRNDGRTVDYEYSLSWNNGVKMTVNSQTGQSFFSADNTKWNDCKNDRYDNFVISALTDNVDESAGEDKRSLTLNESTLSFTRKNETKTLTATVTDKAGNINTNAIVKFVSDNPSVAKVSANGQSATITALSTGTATITVTSGKFSKTCTVSVTVDKAAAPVADKTSGSTIDVGAVISLSSSTTGAEIYYTMDGSDPTSSSTKYSAPITITDSMSGKKITIKAFSVADGFDDSDIVQFNYNVSNTGARIELSDSSIKINAGESKIIKATVYKSDNTVDSGATVAWKSSDSKTVKVVNGRVEGLAEGKATVTAMTGTLSAECAVEVGVDTTFEPVADPPTRSKITVGDSISLSSATEDAQIYYTTDGSTPSRKSQKYTEPIEITNEMAGKELTIKAFAVSDKFKDSKVITARYTVEGKASIKLNMNSYTLTSKKSSVILEATVFGVDGKTDPTAKVSWTSSDTEVATVDGDGKVKPVSEGEAYIIASYDKLSDKCKVTVKYESGSEDDTDSRSALDPNPDTSSKDLYLVKGQSFNLIPFSQGISSSDEKVLGINKSGKVSAKKAGSVTINDKSGTVLFNVRVIEPVISKKNVNMICGETDELEVVLSGAEDLSSEYPVVWICNAPSVAEIEKSDKGCSVRAISKGSATVTAYINGKSYTSKIKVSDTEAVKLTGASSNITLSPLQSIQLKLTGKKFNDVTWTSTLGMKTRESGKKVDYYDGVAYITSSGKLTAIGPGTTTLTCKDNGTVIVLTVPEPTESIIYTNVGKTTSIKYYGVKNDSAQWKYVEDAGVIDTTLAEKNGKIKSLKAGMATVTCKYLPYGDINEGFTYTTKVYVENPMLTTDDKLIAKNQYSYTLSMSGGETYKLSFVNDDTYKVYQPLLFASSKPAVAYVDENGIVHASNVDKKAGTTISCKINGKKISIKLEVNP